MRFLFVTLAALAALLVAMPAFAGDASLSSDDIVPLIALAKSHAWVPFAALVIGLVVRLLKSDTKIPIDIPPRWRTPLVYVLGATAGVLEKIATGASWASALLDGGLAALLAQQGHLLIIDSARSGKELPLPGLIVPGTSPGPDKPVTVKPPPIPPMAMLMLGSFFAPIFGGLFVLMLAGCPKPATGPADADASIAPYIEAGAVIANDVCKIVEGIDDSGVARTVCANVDEVASIVSFITSLRTASDAGAKAQTVPCSNLPGTTFCATSAERAKGVLFIADTRMSRVRRDGGSR